MQVQQRPNESEERWKQRSRIAQNVEIHGIRVVCVECHAFSRHKKKDAGPLRDAECPKCGVLHGLKRLNGWKGARS